MYTFNPADGSESSSIDYANSTLHIYHKDWWGIKSAALLLPGHKYEIGAFDPKPDPDVLYEIMVDNDIRYVFFQGFSLNAAGLLDELWEKTKNDVNYSAVAHVSAAQFDNQFELDMLSEMAHRKAQGMLKEVFSVKPGFSSAIDFCNPHLLVNSFPKIKRESRIKRDYSIGFIPLTRGLRKNMQANHLGLIRSDNYTKIISSISDSCFINTVDDSKVEYLGFISPHIVSKLLMKAGLVMNVTLVECQPMVFNEACAAGVPCLTGPLFLPFAAKHELRGLTEIREADNVKKITQYADNIYGLWKADAKGLTQICHDYVDTVRRLSIESYAEAINIMLEK